MQTIQLKFKQSDFEDVIMITPFSASDIRGDLLKTYANDQFIECGISFSPVEEAFLKSKKGVLRGLHYQEKLEQPKLIVCVSGKAQLVIVDLNKKNVTFGKWISLELRPDAVVYIPGHYAIGTLALEETLLHMGYGERFIAEYSSGIRWDDPDIDVKWLADKNPIIGEKDLNLHSFADFKKEHQYC